MIGIIQNIFDFVIIYPKLLSFLSPILGGENGVIFVSFLSKSGNFSIFTVFLFAFLGMLVIDSLWFFIPRTRLYQKMANKKRISAHYKKLEERLEKLSKGKDILILMLSKVLVGTRILIIIFIGAKKMKYGRFLSVILLPNFIWTGVLVLVGFLARGSYDTIIKNFSNVQLAILVATLFILLFYYLMRIFNRWLIEK